MLERDQQEALARKNEVALLMREFEEVKTRVTTIDKQVRLQFAISMMRKGKTEQPKTEQPKTKQPKPNQQSVELDSGERVRRKKKRTCEQM